MKNIRLTLIVLLFALTNGLFATIPAPVTGGPGCWPPPCVPIDNGVVFLIIAGVLYSAKKFYDFRKGQLSQS